MAPNALEDFAVGEVGAVQGFHVGVRGPRGADDPAGVLQIMPLFLPVQRGVGVPPRPAAEELQHQPRGGGLGPALQGGLRWICRKKSTLLKPHPSHGS